jgi:hypothetical protein
MDPESEGTNLVMFVVGGVVLLLLLLGGGAYFLFASWQEDAARKEVETNLKQINRAVHDFKPDDRDKFMFPIEGEKAQNPGAPDGEANTLQSTPQPKSEKLPKGSEEPAVPKK